MALITHELQGAANTVVKRESRAPGPPGNQSFCCQLMEERVAEETVDAGVCFFEELPGRREEANKMSTQISGHSATEKQNLESHTAA